MTHALTCCGRSPMIKRASMRGMLSKTMLLRYGSTSEIRNTITDHERCKTKSVCKMRAPVDGAVAQQEGAPVQHGEDLRLEARRQSMVLVDRDHNVHVQGVTWGEGLATKPKTKCEKGRESHVARYAWLEVLAPMMRATYPSMGTSASCFDALSESAGRG